MMAVDTSGNNYLISRHEARAADRHLRSAIAAAERYGVTLAEVIRDSLTPDDLAVLETFAGLTKERARNVV